MLLFVFVVGCGPPASCFVGGPCVSLKSYA